MDSKTLLSQVKTDGVRFVSLQFTDVTGAVKSVDIPTHRLEYALEEGVWFDGSSVEGFARIQESDMRLVIDKNTYSLLPWSAEERRRGAATPAFQVGHFQGVQVRILSIGDLGLAPKWEAPHGHAVAGICVRGNHQSAGFIDHAISGQHVSGGAYRGGAVVQLIGGDVQVEQEILDIPHRFLGREYGQDVKTECSSKLKSR